MKRNSVDMLSGSITRGLLSLTGPIMIMNVMQTLFSLLDMAVLKIFSDDGAVGAVGAAGVLISLVTSLLVGLSAGANVVAAKRIGSGKKESTDRAVTTSIIMALIIGALFMLVGVISSRAFFVATNCDASLLDGATVYSKIYFYSVPVAVIYNFCAALLRADGETKKPLYFLIFAGVIKALFTLLFTGVLDMGVIGAALSTAISNTAACILSIRALLKCKSFDGISLKSLKFDIADFKQILFVGIPAGFQGALFSVANVAISAAVNSFGPDATTGVSIANQLDGIIYQICLAPSIAVSPYAAQNMGAGNIKRIRQTLLRAVMITAVFGAGFGSLFAAFSRQLSSIMSSTPAVIEFACQKMIIASSTYFICGTNDVICGILRGMGRPIAPTVSAVVYLCALRFVWVYAVFPLCPNVMFLYTVWPVGWTLSIITLLIVYVSACRKVERAYHLRYPLSCSSKT